MSSVIDYLLEEIRNTPIEEIIALRMEADYRNRYLCPFHDDHTPNNFHINRRKNTFDCYACDTNGDGITFIMEYDHLEFIDAIYQIGYELGLISKKVYETRQGGKKIKSCSQKHEKFVPVENPKADANILHQVYSIFSQGNALIGKQTLSDSHLTMLLKDRNLTMQEIEQTGYFTFPSKIIMKPFLMHLAQEDLDEKVLQTIPGFFYDSTRSSYTFQKPKGEAIGIPIRDEQNRIIGIQLRMDDKSETNMRYSWFSSAFAMGTNPKKNNGMIYGSSPGAPIAVNYPDSIKCKTVFITEGHFKAQILAKTFHAITLSVQGVNNWSGIPETLGNIKESYPFLKHIYIAFDADMARKLTVMQPAIKMGLTLSEIPFTEDDWKTVHAIWTVGNKTVDQLARNYETQFQKVQDCLLQESTGMDIQYVLWNEAYGKGIDDMIEAGNKEHLITLPLSEFWSHTYTFLTKVEEVKETIHEIEEIEFRKISLDEETQKELFEESFPELI